MAIRTVLVLALFVTLVGCGAAGSMASSPNNDVDTVVVDKDIQTRSALWEVSEKDVSVARLLDALWESTGGGQDYFSLNVAMSEFVMCRKEGDQADDALFVRRCVSSYRSYAYGGGVKVPMHRFFRGVGNDKRTCLICGTNKRQVTESFLWDASQERDDQTVRVLWILTNKGRVAIGLNDRRTEVVACGQVEKNHSQSALDRIMAVCNYSFADKKGGASRLFYSKDRTRACFICGREHRCMKRHGLQPY